MDKLETPQKHPLAETFERVWSQALLAVSTAEDEAARCVQRVAELARVTHVISISVQLAQAAVEALRRVEEGGAVVLVP